MSREALRGLGQGRQGGGNENIAWDDVTGMPLDRGAVQEARREEIEYVRSKNVWSKVPRAEAARQGMKVIKTSRQECCSRSSHFFICRG